MNFRVVHKSNGRVRLRVSERKLSLGESRKIRLALLNLPEVTDVRVYQATGGVSVYYTGEYDSVIGKLKLLDINDASSAGYPDTEPESPFVDSREIKRRGLDPHFKRKMRTQVIMEAAFDAVMPTPVQLLYHAYQLAKINKM